MLLCSTVKPFRVSLVEPVAYLSDSYDGEAMYQFGAFGAGTISAWRLAADNAYTFSSARWHPRLRFAVDVASGDRDPANPNLQTFNALFQSGTYSGRAQLLGPANAIRL